MSYLLGIDLGTTRTSAAVGHAGARPGDLEVVNLGDRSSSVPSVFYAGADGSVLVGDAAERRALTDPARVVREFKRRIGDPTPLVVAGVPWSPQELSARVVRWVVDRVSERQGGPAARIAVTHPASWGPLKRELLGGALAGQGLHVAFLPEPQAAALHYASAERLEPGSTIAVYDLGGGTFDAAVVHKDVQGFGLLGRPEGIERLGGVDFDQVVFDHVRASLPEAFTGLDEGDPAVLSAVAAVRRECSEAKEALSSDTEVSVQVLMPGHQGTVRLHRSEFESMIRPQIEDTVAALRRAVVSAGLTSDQLTAVLLVGGSSRIPLVAQLVSEQLGRPVAVDADPKNAIAMGAALSLDPAAVHGTGGHVPAPRAAAPSTHPIGAGGRGPSGPGPGWAGGAMADGAGAGGVIGAGSTGGYGSPMGTGQGYPPPGPPQQRLGPMSSMGSGMAPVAPPRPAPYPDRPPVDYRHHDEDDGYYRDAGPAPRRSSALLVSAGGIAAAVAVLAAVFLLPSVQRGDTENLRGTSPVPSLPESSVVDTPSADPTSEEPAPNTADRPPPRTSAPPPASSAPPTSAPPTSAPPTSEPPPSTPPPTTPPTTEPSTPPPNTEPSVPPGPAAVGR